MQEIIMEEEWVPWIPINNLSQKYNIESISDNYEEGLKIALKPFHDPGKKRVLVVFKDSVDSYKRTDETFTVTILDYIGENYGHPLYGFWTFFKVNNSNYLKSLSAQSYGISEILFIFLSWQQILYWMLLQTMSQ